MALERDSLGRIKRKIRKRPSPLTMFRRGEFLARYRLPKNVVKTLVAGYKRFSAFKGSPKAGGLSHLDRFCLVLRYFATGGSYSLTADNQRVSPACLSRSVEDVSNYFYANREKFIQWPKTLHDKVACALKFYRHKTKLTEEEKQRRGTDEEFGEQRTPHIFGIVDGTHIPIRCPPKAVESTYVCRKGYHSINTTVICDHDRHIMYVDPRWPGSVNDAYALKSSPVGDEIEQEKWGKFKLLADSGYGLKRNVLTPYKDENTPKRRRYNKWHRRNRVRVEQGIGILKQRWRILDSSCGKVRHDPDRAAKIIVSCCCLHNVALDYGVPMVTHPAAAWTPTYPRLAQPDQLSQTEAKERIRRFRDAYVDKHF